MGDHSEARIVLLHPISVFNLAATWKSINYTPVFRSSFISKISQSFNAYSIPFLFLRVVFGLPIEIKEDLFLSLKSIRYFFHIKERWLNNCLRYLGTAWIWQGRAKFIYLYYVKFTTLYLISCRKRWNKSKERHRSDEDKCANIRQSENIYIGFKCYLYSKRVRSAHSFAILTN